ncbi:MAG TPA: hypothetical protein VFE85_06830, partial [Woeseiaceae bacterium]|nr:hypothetical protein [Woeseiaceae bacterium]
MKDPAIQTDLLQAAAAALPDDALRQVREAALREFAHAGLPAARDEDWKYTNLSPAAALSNDWLRHIAATAATAAASAARAAPLPDFDAYWI